MNPAVPGISVVVAARREDGDLRTCLSALLAQRDDRTEVVIASAGAGHASFESPWARWLEAPADTPVPRLWGMALAQAQGAVVAFTTAQFRPSPDWLAVIRDCHARLPAAAIGGSIDPPSSGRPFDWAVYLLRYSSYLAYDRESTVPDLAGDNASYKRGALRAIGADAAEEFWEQEAHRKLLARGESLVFVPGMRVQQVASFPVAVFLRQRLRHGRRFGAERARRHGVLWRAAALCASPLIPVVLVAKVVLRVLRARRHAARLARSLPALVACAVAWAAGEARGYWSANPKADGRP